MNKFELTERGKIVIAIVLVLLILVLPAVILAFKAMASQPPASPSAAAAEPEAPVLLPDGVPPPENALPPATVDEQPPGNGGFVPGEPESADSEYLNNEYPTGAGEPALDLVGEKLSFFYSPDSQSSLDHETLSVLDVFLSLPKNIPQNTIAIETPVLPEEKAGMFTAVITETLAERGVPDRRLAYIVDPNAPLGDFIEVSLYYIVPTNVK